jgi:hypothetical protein
MHSLRAGPNTTLWRAMKPTDCTGRSAANLATTQTTTRTRRLLAPISLAVAVAGLFAAPPSANAAPASATAAPGSAAPAQDATASRSVARDLVASQDLAAVHAFWTPDRVRRAKALDVPTADTHTTAAAAGIAKATAASTRHIHHERRSRHGQASRVRPDRAAALARRGECRRDQYGRPGVLYR